MQHGHIKILPGEGSGGAGKNPIELRTVESDQQQIDAGIKRLDDGRADIVVVDRPIIKSSVMTVGRRLSLTDDPHPEERPLGRVSKDGSGQSWFETALRSASSPRGSSPGSPPVPKLFVRCQSIKASAKYLRKTSDLPPNPPQQLHIYRTGRTPTCSGSRRLYPKMIGDEFLD